MVTRLKQLETRVRPNPRLPVRFVSPFVSRTDVVPEKNTQPKSGTKGRGGSTTGTTRAHTPNVNPQTRGDGQTAGKGTNTKAASNIPSSGGSGGSGGTI